MKARLFRDLAPVLALLLLAGACRGEGGAETATTTSDQAAATTTTAAATTTPSGEPQRGGRLIIGAPADVVTLDPVDGGGTVSTQVKRLIYDGLVSFTPDLEVLPDLAESWEADGIEWVFTLRQGVVFHDGTPFTAEAVKQHFDRLLTGETQRSSDWVSILESVEVVDDHTVRFVTQFVDSAFLQRLASDSGPIPSPAVEPGTLERNPVGTGPFRFVEWVPDTRVVVERNPDFWGDEPYLDEVEFRPIPEAGARVIALQAGDVHVAAQIPPELVETLETDPAFELDIQDTVRQLWIGMHNLKEPFTDQRVRMAMNLAVDMESIAENIYGGLAVPLPSGLPNTAAGYADLPNLGYDPDRARTLLEEAGLPDGFTTEVVGTRGRYLKDFELQQAVIQQLREVGIVAELESVEFSQYIDLVRQDTLTSDLVVWQDAWSGVIATEILRQRYHCDAFRPNGINLAGYCNEDFSALVDEAQVTLDDAGRSDLLRQAQEILQQDAPSIFGVAVRQVAGTAQGVHGVLHFPTEELSVDEYTWMEQ